MDARGMQEEARIAEKQMTQDAEAKMAAEEVIAAQGGEKVSEFEEAASRNRGL